MGIPEGGDAFLKETNRFTQLFKKKLVRGNLVLALTPSIENQRTCFLYYPGKHLRLSAYKNSGKTSKFFLQHQYNVKQISVRIRKIISQGYYSYRSSRIDISQLFYLTFGRSFGAL